MILLDTSLWIDVLGRHPTVLLREEERADVVTCPLIIQEILQGIGDDLAHRRLRASLLALPRLADPLDLDLCLEAADIYRRGRRKGLTLRSSVDCLIAACAIRHQVPIWHRDRDFAAIASFTALEAVAR